MSRFCVIAGTKITLNNGTSLPIENIKVGEEVLSFDLNSLQKSQKYEILVKLKTNNFDGVVKKDIVKNIWKNIVEEYFSINDKLKITGNHIVLAKRDNFYFWTKVVNLKIGDYLFTEFNIFEKIETMIIIKEKVKVFNLEVNSIYNYFANSYLIHNGAPCSSCGDNCGKYIEETTPGGYLLRIPQLTGYTNPVAQVYLEGAMGSLHEDTNPENALLAGQGAKIIGTFPVASGGYLYYFVGGGDGSNFGGTAVDSTGSGDGASGENYNGGGYGAYRRDSNTEHGFKGGGCSFIAYSSSDLTDTSLNSADRITINTGTPKNSSQLKDFADSDSLKRTIMIVAGGGGGMATLDEETPGTGNSRTLYNGLHDLGTGGNGGFANGAITDQGPDWFEKENWVTNVDGVFIEGSDGEANLEEDSQNRKREGGKMGNAGSTSVLPQGGTGGQAYPAWGGGPHDAQKGEFGVGGFTHDIGRDSATTSGNYGSGSSASTNPGPPGGASSLRGGGGGGGIYGGGAGSLAGGGGGGGLSYYKSGDSGTTTWITTHYNSLTINGTDRTSGTRDPINRGTGTNPNTSVDNYIPQSADEFNGKVVIYFYVG